MRFLIDENLPADFAATARSEGHDASWVRDETPGANDRVILDRLRTTGEILVTRDVRFANMVLALTTAEGSPRMVIPVREQQSARLRLAWRRFLRDPKQVDGIVVATADRLRYRHARPRND